MKPFIKSISLGALVIAGAAWAVKAEDPEIGKPAPNFTLTDVQGAKRSLADFKGKYVVLEWVNHGCPFVVKHYDTNNMQSLQKEYTGKNVAWLSICTSAKGKEGYMEPAEWVKTNKEKGVAATAVLLDSEGTVGRLYKAKTTPHMFVINPEGILVYKGAIDDKASTNKEDVKTAKSYVKAALDESMAGKPVSKPSTQSYGCSVKYK